MVNMFRGAWKISWANLLIEAGWPDPQARRMADFLVGDVPDVPTWKDMMAHAESLTRYGPIGHGSIPMLDGGMEEDDLGDYVRYDDLMPPTG